MKEEIIGQKCFDHFKTKDCNTENCATAQAFRNGKNVSAETTAKPGSKNLDFRYTSVPLTDEKGEIVAAFEMFVDETDIKSTMRVNKKRSDYRQNQTEKIVSALQRLAEGDVDFKIVLDAPDEELQGAYDQFMQIVDAIHNTGSTISALSSDANLLASSAKEGRLDVRADAGKHKGEYKNIITGFNNALDNLIRPVNMAAEYVDRISKGDIPPKITDEYRGDFNELKNNLNTCIDAIGALVVDINVMSEAAIAGKLRTRSDANRHQGDFRKIIIGINNTLDGVVEPLSIAAKYIENISNGDLSKSIEDDFKGDFNGIKQNINSLIRNLNGFLSDVRKISTLHQQGEIDVYLDTDKAKGFYLEMNSSVNDWAKYHISSILHILEIVQSYGEGDLSPRINRFPGKQAIAHERIDRIQANLNSVVTEIDHIINATQDGKLDYRGDASKFPGAYKNIIAGLNKALDSVIEPLNLSADFIENISNGILPAKIDKEVKGDINILKNNINNLIDNMNGLFVEMNIIIDGISVGKLDVRGRNDKFKGVWNDLVKSMNEIMVQVQSPISELVEILTLISVNDYSRKVTKDYEGIWDELKVATNNTMARLENVLAIIKGVAVGKLDKLEELKGIGRRSENDELIPSFIKLMETIASLAEDVKMLTTAAIEGNLSARADADQHFGEYKTIVQGFNSTLNALNEPIEEAGEVLNTMSTGDLTVKMKGNYKGDHKKLQDSINLLSESLNDLISKILDGVETTASASIQISSTADTIATSSQEQSAQTEEVASAIEQMARTVTDNATNAQKTADVARQNREVAKEGGTIVEQTVGKMSDIAAVVKESAENIEKLGESSKQIGEIISVIDDIADQTNLLALNAAIEAARAGEQGRGFAVVADEVRKLAERTTEATKKIAQMIKGIQKDTDNAVKVMQNGNSEVSNGIHLADKAGLALKEIVTSSQHLLDMISQIATANEEQAATGEQITKNVSMISEVTHDSSRRITEIAQSSDELSRLTEDLRSLVDQFKIQKTDYQLTGSDSMRSVGNKAAKRYLADSNAF